MHPSWESIEGATWISTDEYVEDPLNDSWRWFQDEMELPEKGYYLEGSVVMANSDNAEAAYHNGVMIGSDGDVEDFEDEHQWATIQEYDFTPVKGLNTFDFVVMNLGLADSTLESNPTGLIYKISASYYPEETAWGEGERFVDKGNWATYMTYEVQEVEVMLESVVYDGEGDTFGSHLDDIMTFAFSNDVERDGNINVYFEDAQRFEQEWGKAEYNVLNNTLTVTVTEEWTNPRPEVGDYVTSITGLVDTSGDPVVVPDGGIEVTD